MSTDIDDLLPGAPLLVTGRLVAVGVPESALRDLRERCEQQAGEIERLRAALTLALDLSENGLIDFEKYGLKCDADIEKVYRAALAERK